MQTLCENDDDDVCHDPNVQPYGATEVSRCWTLHRYFAFVLAASPSEYANLFMKSVRNEATDAGNQRTHTLFTDPL